MDEVPAWSPDGVILKQEVDEREFEVSIPANCKLEYDLEGHGRANVEGDRLILRRDRPETLVWRRFRLVPLQFMSDDN